MESNLNNKEIQGQFLKGLNDYLKSKHFPIEPRSKRHPQAEVFPLGRNGVELGVVAMFTSKHGEPSDQYDNEIRVELIVEGSSSISIDCYEDKLVELSSDFESNLYMTGELGKRRKLGVRKSVDLMTREEWPVYFVWIRDNLKRMQRMYNRRISK